MFDDENSSCSLITDIKIEPEEFQTINESLSEETLKPKAEIDPDPEEISERKTLRSQAEVSKLETNEVKQLQPNKGKSSKCPDCNLRFSKKEALRRHKLEQHYEGTIYKCHCGSVFMTNWELNQHQTYHGSKKETCRVCKRIFANLPSLRCHYRKQHLKTHGPM